MLAGMAVCIPLTAVFFLPSTRFWLPVLVLAGYGTGCAVAAWGYFLREYTPQNQRIKSTADVLIYSNLIMVAVNIITINLSTAVGLALATLCLPLGMVCIWLIPTGAAETWAKTTDKKLNSGSDIYKPVAILFLFVAMITVDSGLMYQAINPGFEHLTELTSWYWALPYIVALAVVRNLPTGTNRTPTLYIGMVMIMCAFIGFMLLGRSAGDYLIVDTLMLGACGILDLFWWSIIGETLNYGKNPVKIFGICLSANVLGVLCGDIIGITVTSIGLSEAQVAVIALCVVCVTLILLPPLNRQFALLLKSHVYLQEYSVLSERKQERIAAAVKPLDPLTERETDILRLVLDGKGNKDISRECFITENTVKTHLKSIYSKYAVASRAELISLLLRNQKH